MNAKTKQIIKIVKEFDVSSSKNNYNISGLDTSLIKVFYREPQKTYEDLAVGNYKFDFSNNTQALIIQNQDILNIAESLQICYVFDLTSSEYDVNFEVDINTLKDDYNKAVKDLHTLWEYVKELGFVADEENFSIILPQLADGEVWVKTAEGWKGFQIGKLEQEIQVLLKQITDATTQALQDIENSKNSALLGITNTGNGQNTRIIDQGNTQSTRLNSIDTEVSTKLDLMQRMMSVIVGANRWLDGGNIATRDINNLERTADGGDITQRVGLPNRIYDAGDITQRVVDVPLEIDLGQK